MSNMSSIPESLQSAYPSSYSMPQKRNVSLFFNVGVFCAFISLFLVPEIFGSAAIILGAYIWKLESTENRNRGLFLIVFGIIAMFVGLYYTSYFTIYEILP